MLAQIWRPEGFGEPRLLLLDEPANNLDPAQRLAVMRRIRSLADSGLAIVVVLHDLTEALRFADQGLLLRDGWTLAQGPIGEVVTPGLMAAAFDVEAAIITSGDFPAVISMISARDSRVSYGQG